MWPERIRKSWLEFRQDKEFQEWGRTRTIEDLHRAAKVAENEVESIISHWITKEKGAELRAKLYKKGDFSYQDIVNNPAWPDFKLQLSQLERAISELHNLERLLDEARSSEVK